MAGAPFLRLGGRPVPTVGRARIYVCGVTPYDTTHLGHASTFLWADLAGRVLAASGAEVTLARNITDVDDDLLEEARRRGETWQALAARQTYRFEDDMQSLGVAPPAFEPLAHNYIQEVAQLASALLESGHAYEHEGHVYFRGEDVVEASGLDHTTAVGMLAASNDHPDDPGKQHPFDVAVWQASGPDEPAWPSAFGPGRPGWHAECAAMAMATLGTGIDVHGGGADLAFPHHAYEAALAEAVTGVRPFARAWLRAGTVHVGGRKMAKSTGNLVLVHDLLERWSPAAIRLLVLSRPWHEPWDFEESQLAEAEDRVGQLHHWGRSTALDEGALAGAVGALCNDLDVVSALEVAERTGGETLRRVVELIGITEAPRAFG